MKKRKTIVFEPHLDSVIYDKIEAYKLANNIPTTKQALIALANKGLSK